MPPFRKKQDPIADRERDLKAQITALERQIKHLHQQVETERGQPKLRSTATPHPGAAAGAGGQASEPAFEDVNHHPVQSPATEPESTPSHYNELGLRKYDPLAPLRRWLRQWRGAPPGNPKLVNYLAAGSVHGLRPLRYEKRIARNRFLTLCALFVAILWGLIYFYFRNR